MNNEEILQTIADRQPGENSEEDNVEAALIKFLIFSIDDRLFALPADMIREIVLDLPVYYVPFVPTYVRGVINRHGEPFTVIDLLLLFEQKILDASTFLILSGIDNPAAFIISDVIEILKIEEKNVSYLSGTQSGDIYVNGSLNTGKGKEILILSIPEIFRRLERDLD